MAAYSGEKPMPVKASATWSSGSTSGSTSVSSSFDSTRATSAGLTSSGPASSTTRCCFGCSRSRCAAVCPMSCAATWAHFISAGRKVLSSPSLASGSAGAQFSMK